MVMSMLGVGFGRKVGKALANAGKTWYNNLHFGDRRVLPCDDGRQEDSGRQPLRSGGILLSNLEAEIKRRRTFAIISHPDAGKTTLTEKFLLYGGAIAQAGEVKGKRARAATSDWMEIERQRGISVTSSVMQFQHGGYCVNILDTPGHQDFSEDTYRTLMAADSAVMVIDGAKGVEPQTRKLFKVCAMRKIPIFTFINKMDRETRDPLELCEEVEKELGIDTYAVNWPIGCGKEFRGSTIGSGARSSSSLARATAKRPLPPRSAWMIPSSRTSSARSAGGSSGTRWSCWGPAGSTTWRPSGRGS